MPFFPGQQASVSAQQGCSYGNDIINLKLVAAV